MGTLQKPEEYLATLYQKIDDVRNDFRNYNLNYLISRYVKGKSILDIGCGNGFLLSFLRKKRKMVYGIEPNKKLIKLAKRNAPEVKIYNGRAEDMDNFITDKVDCILMVDVLEHIENDISQIQKIYKHLKKFGQFIIVVPAFQFLYGKRDKNLGHFRRYSKKELFKKLSEKGFRIISARYWNMLGFFPYLFCEKILRKELNVGLRTQQKNPFKNF